MQSQGEQLVTLRLVGINSTALESDHVFPPWTQYDETETTDKLTLECVDCGKKERRIR